MSDAHDWRSELQRRETLQSRDDITVMVSALPYNKREALRAWLVEQTYTGALLPGEAQEIEQFKREVCGHLPWVRKQDRETVLRIVRTFVERR